MNFQWNTVANCEECGLGFSNIEPNLIVGSPEVGMYWILCPCCLNLREVSGIKENMKKIIYSKGILVNPNMTGKKLLHHLYMLSNEKKNSKANAVLNNVKRQRAQIGLEPLQLK